MGKISAPIISATAALYFPLGVPSSMACGSASFSQYDGGTALYICNGTRFVKFTGVVQ